MDTPSPPSPAGLFFKQERIALDQPSHAELTRPTSILTGRIAVDLSAEAKRAGQSKLAKISFGKIVVKTPNIPMRALPRILLSGLMAATAPASFANTPAYLDSTAPIERRVDDLLARLTLAEKVAMCTPAGWMEAGGVPRLGVPVLKMADGPQGVTRHTTPAGFPCGIALSCTWNVDAAREYGEILADETLGVGRHMILGPAVNLMRTPLCGRNFEYFGEDPVLSGKIAAAYIRGVQSREVAPSLKHLVANNQENHRWLTSANMDERTLRELYLLPFEIAVKESHPWCIMSSYNRLNGVYLSQNRAIQEDIVKKEWGFDGVVVSDWNAVHDAKGAALGGLDLEMGSDFWKNKKSGLVPLVESGEVPVSVLDEKVRRMIRLMIRTQALNPERRRPGANNTPAHRAKLRAFAAEGMVLLRNADGILPLDKSRPGKVLVTGPNAAKEHRGEGGSGGVYSPYEVTPLQGLREVFGERVRYVPGYTYPGANPVPADCLRTPAGDKGLACEFFDNREMKGTPVVAAVSPTVNFRWGDAMFGLPSDQRMPVRKLSVRATGRLIAPFTGKVKLVLNGDGGRLSLDGRKLIDLTDAAPGKDGKRKVTSASAELDLVEGRGYDLAIEYSDAAHNPELALRWEFPSASPEAAIEAARDADTVIFIGGTHHGYDTEGAWGESAHDIPNLELPGPQAELISRLAAVNKRVIVVLVNGSVVSTESWVDRVPGIIEAWYGGQEAGNALADILTGKVNPSGKLSATFGKQLTDYACHAQRTYPGVIGPLSKNPHSNYKEGVFIGYRWFESRGITPRFPFGHGLSYTTFSIKPAGIRIPDDSADTPRVRVSATVTNTGERAGAQVVQLYVGEDKPAVPRPVKELKGFAKVMLAPGESKTVDLDLDVRAFAHWDVATRTWRADAGNYTITVGDSSANAAFTEKVSLKR